MCAPAYQIARAIADREISAVEVLEAHLARIAGYNAQLNAICSLGAERARQQAQQADALVRGENWGKRHGIPITIKDCFETAGLVMASGYKPLKGNRKKLFVRWTD